MNQNLLALIFFVAGAITMLAGYSHAKEDPITTRPAYVLADFQLTDASAIKPYGEQVEATFRPYGGRFLIRGGKATPLEGELLQGRLIVIAFDDAEQAQAWYSSPAYRKLREIRLRSGVTRMAIVEGVPSPKTAAL